LERETLNRGGLNTINEEGSEQSPNYWERERETGQKGEKEQEKECEKKHAGRETDNKRRSDKAHPQRKSPAKPSVPYWWEC